MSELAEGARLEIVCAVKSGTEGSNPSLSAILISKALGTISILNDCLRYFSFRCQSPGSKVQRLDNRRVQRFSVQGCPNPEPLNPERWTLNL